MATSETTDAAVEFPAEVTERTCCRCGARSYVFAVFAHGPLGWCSHHGTEAWDAINKQALPGSITDHRDQVLPKPVADES